MLFQASDRRTDSRVGRDQKRLIVVGPSKLKPGYSHGEDRGVDAVRAGSDPRHCQSRVRTRARRREGRAAGRNLAFKRNVTG